MFEMTPFEKTYRNIFGINPFADFGKDFLSHTGTKLSDFQIDVQDLGDAYLLEADLPGFEKQDIKLELHDHRLTIRAERRASSETKDAKGSYLRQERTYGSFTRSFDIREIDEANIKAAYENGVLKLTLPKQQEETPATQEIAIS